MPLGRLTREALDFMALQANADGGVGPVPDDQLADFAGAVHRERSSARRRITDEELQQVAKAYEKARPVESRSAGQCRMRSISTRPTRHGSESRRRKTPVSWSGHDSLRLLRPGVAPRTSRTRSLEAVAAHPRRGLIQPAGGERGRGVLRHRAEPVAAVEAPTGGGPAARRDPLDPTVGSRPSSSVSRSAPSTATSSGSTFPVFTHYGVRAVGARGRRPIDPGSEAHDLVMMLFGGMSKGERSASRPASARR